MMKAKWILLLGAAFLLALPISGTAAGLCSDGTMASLDKDIFLGTLQSPQAVLENQPEQASLPAGGIQATNCTIELCMAAREVCAQYCTFPCKPLVLCTGTYCGVCRGCSC
jgi:hypothetical protein